MIWLYASLIIQDFFFLVSLFYKILNLEKTALHCMKNLDWKIDWAKVLGLELPEIIFLRFQNHKMCNVRHASQAHALARLKTQEINHRGF